MKKLILLTVLQVCFLAVKAQNNISFSISQQMKNSTLWITSTITNNDPRELAILDGWHISKRIRFCISWQVGRRNEGQNFVEKGRVI